MTLPKLLLIGLLCLAVCFFIGAAVTPAFAQSDGDKKKDDKLEGPSKLQMAVGVGSIFVMIIVVKWL